jgi:hypothetical protein
MCTVTLCGRRGGWACTKNRGAEARLQWHPNKQQNRDDAYTEQQGSDCTTVYYSKMIRVLA